jgi:predicted  nucleic acid-binding Zn-ribbon protein
MRQTVGAYTGSKAAQELERQRAAERERKALAAAQANAQLRADWEKKYLGWAEQQEAQLDELQQKQLDLERQLLEAQQELRVQELLKNSQDI